MPLVTPWMPNRGAAVAEAKLRQGGPCNAIEGTRARPGQTNPAVLPLGAAVP